MVDGNGVLVGFVTEGRGLRRDSSTYFGLTQGVKKITTGCQSRSVVWSQTRGSKQVKPHCRRHGTPRRFKKYFLGNRSSPGPENITCVRVFPFLKSVTFPTTTELRCKKGD